MAETAISLVIQKVTDAFIEEAAFLSEVPNNINWIKTELNRMRCFLADADAKGTFGDAMAKNWVKEIRDVAYEAEEIIDVIRLKIEKRRHESTGGCMILSSATRCVCAPKSLITCHKIGAKIDIIKKKIEDIASSRARYGIEDLGEDVQHDAVNQVNALMEFHRRGEETDIVGFENDKLKLVKLLLDADNKRLSAVTIVGMGGLGKTTLARKVYRDPEISKHFDATAFVSVSQTLNSVFLIKYIIKQVMPVTTETQNDGNGITKDELDSMSEEDAKEILLKFLIGRRYLIALDDSWEINDWYRLKETFPDTHNGSRLLITTRNLDIAGYADQNTPPHELQKLSDEESWELFNKKAFPGKRRCPEDLEEFGRLFSRRCCGLPLAIVVLGGLFSRLPRDRVAWLEVRNRINWESTTDASICLDILALSYNHLPHRNLRLCFLYIGHFPEDWEINASHLIRLWVAEGLVQQTANQTREETARYYLDELVQRSMVQAAERSMVSGKIKSVRIHDLLRDLCIRKSREDGFMVSCTRVNDSSSEDMTVYRRIAVSQTSTIEPLLLLQKKLHTLLCFVQLERVVSLGSLKLLRVIDVKVQGTRGEFKFPYEIGSLIHLRYMRCEFLGDYPEVELPSNIGNLYNLQTLDLVDAIVRFPTSFWRIPALRHVRLVGCVYMDRETTGPRSIRALKQLQTLFNVQAGKWIKKDLSNAAHLRKLGVTKIRASDVEPLANALQKLDNLVSLELKAPYTVKYSTSILEALQSRNQLRSLKLYGFIIEEFPATANVFSPNLTKLMLGGLHLKHDPMPVLEQLPNLVRLKLYITLVRRTMRSSAGCFPQLQFLIISGLDKLEEWIVETGAMSKLTHLFIYSCDKLEEWIVETGAMSKLTHLLIYKCKELKMIPDGLKDITSLQELTLQSMHEDFNRRVCAGGEDWDKVKHIPSITIK